MVNNIDKCLYILEAYFYPGILACINAKYLYPGYTIIY